MFFCVVLDKGRCFSMISSGYFVSGPMCNCSGTASYISNSLVEEDGVGANVRDDNSVALPASFWVRMAMGVSRARWFIFLRRVFHYQNGSRSDLGSDPFNSSSWMAMELVAMVFQLAITVFFLAISKTEKPVWPMRLWIVGYDLGCVLSLLLLYGRYWHLYLMRGDRVSLSDTEQRRSSQASRYSLTCYLLYIRMDKAAEGMSLSILLFRVTWGKSIWSSLVNAQNSMEEGLKS